MRSLFPRFLLFMMLFTASFLPGMQGYAKGPIVLELFTSQACADSLPADNIFREVVQQSDVIGISCHVTFMNRPVWSDNMSREFCDRRMGDYMYSLGMQSVNTPTLVMNGKYDMRGDNKAMVLAALNMARVEEDVIPLDLAVEGGRLSLGLPAMDLLEEVDIWLYSYNEGQRVLINGGDNAGRLVDYAHTAKSLNKLMRWDGAAKTLAIDVAHVNTDKVAILVQGADGVVVAAGHAPVKPSNIRP